MNPADGPAPPPGEVLLIIGYGHSGTTILDLVLGSAPGSFSCGELTHFTREGFFDEFCSCGVPISTCTFWSRVFADWRAVSPCTLDEYKTLRTRFEGNKAFPAAVLNYFRPSPEFTRYVHATSQLYDCIFRHSGARTLVDSSKSASRAFLLASFTRIRVLHVCRSFRGVLNSEKKDIRIDLENGIEADSPPKRTSRVFKDWLISNLMCAFARRIFAGRTVHYAEWIRSPSMLHALHPALQPGFESGLFKAPHMIAGNAIRLKPPQPLRVPKTFTYPRLTPRQDRFARVVERILPFWNR